VSYDVDVKKVVKEHPYTKQYYKKTGKVRMYKGKGCPTCNHSGYHGRTSVFEYIRITEEMRELILSHPSSQDIWKLARTQGAVALFDDGMEKVRSGVITIDELLRIAKPPTY
jgi:type II secretory ATPase GspE/PulE/Tfp pilus assembly ATPase PilB-like protein